MGDLGITAVVFAAAGAVAVILCVFLCRRRGTRAKAPSRVNFARISGILFAASGVSFAAFMLFVIFFSASGDTVLWRVFSVSMPVTGVCLIGGAVSAFVDFIGKRR